MAIAQTDLFGREKSRPKPRKRSDRTETLAALDELFHAARRYRTSAEFMSLLQFVRGFRWYAPFNAMLIHVQRPGAAYCAPANRWRREYGRSIRTGAMPMVILQPMGPVMFVFDVGDTEPLPGSAPLPVPVVNPHGATGGKVGSELPRTLENAKRDGVRAEERASLGNQLAGFITIRVGAAARIEFPTRVKPPESVSVPVRFDVVLDSGATAETKYATLVHELAHLYCGHLGTPDDSWWPDRRGLPKEAREFEAESVSYLVCGRLGITTPSAGYLSGYTVKNNEIPSISLDAVLWVAGLIESMGRRRLAKRKPGRRQEVAE